MHDGKSEAAAPLALVCCHSQLDKPPEDLVKAYYAIQPQSLSLVSISI